MPSRRDVVTPLRLTPEQLVRIQEIRETYRDKTFAAAKRQKLPLISKADAMRWIIDLGIEAAEAYLNKPGQGDNE